MSDLDLVECPQCHKISLEEDRALRKYRCLYVAQCGYSRPFPPEPDCKNCANYKLKEGAAMAQGSEARPT